MKFPQYRKYKGLETYFKIISETEMTEIKVIGEKYMSVSLKAKIFPEKMMINDLISNEGERWQILSEKEYENAVSEILNSKTKIG